MRGGGRGAKSGRRKERLGFFLWRLDFVCEDLELADRETKSQDVGEIGMFLEEGRELGMVPSSGAWERKGYG